MILYILIALLCLTLKNWLALGCVVTLFIYHKINEREASRKILVDSISKVFSNFPIPVAVLDKFNIYLSTSESWINFFKFKFNPKGKNHFEVFPSLTEKCKTIHDIVSKGNVVESYDFEFTHFDGSKDIFDYIIIPILNNGDLVGRVIAINPKSTLVKLEKELEDLSHQLSGIQEIKAKASAYEDILDLVESIGRIENKNTSIKDKFDLALDHIPEFSLLPKNPGFLVFIKDLNDNFNLLTSKNIEQNTLNHLNNNEFKKQTIWKAISSREIVYKAWVDEPKLSSKPFIPAIKTAYVVPLLSENEVLGILVIAYQDLYEQNYFETKLYSYLGKALGGLIRRHSILQKLENEKIQRSELMKKQRLLFASISHDIRGYTQNILGLSEHLTSIISDNKITKTDLLELSQNLISASLSLNDLIGDLLDLVKYQESGLKIKNEVFDLFSMLDEIIKQFTPKLKPQVEIQIQLDNNLKQFYEGPKVRIQQVLTNLVSNAVKFTKHGYIKISAKLITSNESDMVQFKVIDTGIGIPHDQLDKIFNPFEQVEDSMSANRGGTGLGLWISKKIVRAMGDDLQVKSKLGVGTEFWFSVNLIPARSIVFQNQKTSIYTDPLKILIADDDPISLKLLKKILENEGHTVLTANNGFEALNTISLDPNINIAIMDLHMPILDGMEAAKKIREFNKTTKLIALTGSVGIEERDFAPFDLVLSKPIRKDYMLEQIASIIES